MTTIRNLFLNDQDDRSNATDTVSINTTTDSEVNRLDHPLQDELLFNKQVTMFGPDDDDDDDDDLIPIEDDEDDLLADDDDVLPDGGDDDLLDDDEDDFLAEEADDDLLADNDDDTGSVDDDEDDDYDGDIRSVGDLSPPSERSHGRTTGRMIDHEPGTPNNI
jgi:hypothetical protein